jgi:acyl carrier protein
MRVLKGWFPGKEISKDSHLYKDLGLDSLDVMELGMQAEDVFNISVPEDRTVETVEDLVCLISREVLRGAERKCEEDCREAVSAGR